MNRFEEDYNNLNTLYEKYLLEYGSQYTPRMAGGQQAAQQGSPSYRKGSLPMGVPGDSGSNAYSSNEIPTTTSPVSDEEKPEEGHISKVDILAKIDEMKSISVIDSTKYKDENGKAASLKKLFLKYETNKTRNAIQEAADKREEEERRKKEQENQKFQDPPKKLQKILDKKFNDPKLDGSFEVKVDDLNDKNSSFTVKQTISRERKGVTKTYEDTVNFSDNKMISLSFFTESGIVKSDTQQEIRPSDLYKAIMSTPYGGKSRLLRYSFSDIKDGTLLEMLGYDYKTGKKMKSELADKYSDDLVKELLKQINIVFKEAGYEQEFDIVSMIESEESEDVKKRLARYIMKLSEKMTGIYGTGDGKGIPIDKEGKPGEEIVLQ